MDDEDRAAAVVAAHAFLRDKRVPLGVKMMISDANPLIEAIERAIISERARCALAVRNAPSLDENGYIVDKNVALIAIGLLPPKSLQADGANPLPDEPNTGSGPTA